MARVLSKALLPKASRIVALPSLPSVSELALAVMPPTVSVSPGWMMYSNSKTLELLPDL